MLIKSLITKCILLAWFLVITILTFAFALAPVAVAIIMGWDHPDIIGGLLVAGNLPAVGFIVSGVPEWLITHCVPNW